MFEEQEFKKILLVMKTCMVVSIIATCIGVFVVICTHWRGFSFSISPVAAPDTKVVVIERAAPVPTPAPVHLPKPHPMDVPHEDIPLENAPLMDLPKPSYQSEVPLVSAATARIQTPVPDLLTEANIQGGYAARAPAYGEVTEFAVTVRPKKHRWPRRLFGAIGHGFGKVLGVR